MPSGCCVPGCSNRGGIQFPRDPDLRMKWLVAIRRREHANSLKLWTPSARSVVCHDHFTPEDYYEVNSRDSSQSDRRIYSLHESSRLKTYVFEMDEFDTNGTGTEEVSGVKRKLMLEPQIPLTTTVDPNTPSETAILKKRVTTTASSEELTKGSSEMTSWSGKSATERSDLSNEVVKKDFENVFMTHLLHFWKTKQFCDLYLQFKNTTVMMHQLVLLIAKPSCIAQMQSSSKNCRLLIVPYTIQPKAIHNFLMYLYTGRLLLDETTVDDILVLTRFFNLASLEYFCTHFMKARETTDRSKSDTMKTSSYTVTGYLYSVEKKSRRKQHDSSSNLDITRGDHCYGIGYHNSVVKKSQIKQSDASSNPSLNIDQPPGVSASDVGIHPHSIHGAGSVADIQGGCDEIPQEVFTDQEMSEEVDHKPIRFTCDSVESDPDLTWKVVKAEDGTRSMCAEDMKPVLSADGTIVAGESPGIPPDSRTSEQPPEAAEHTMEGDVEDLKPIVLADGSVYSVQMTSVSDASDQEEDAVDTVPEPVCLVGNATTFHKCCRCPKVFGSKREMWEHVESHYVGTWFRCQFCGQNFTSKVRVDAHEAQHSSKLHQHFCHTCKEVFPTKSDLRDHIKAKNHFECDVCLQVFFNSTEYMRHTQECWKLVTTVCNICHITFPDTFQLSEHALTHGPCSKNMAVDDPNICPKSPQNPSCSSSASSTSSEPRKINCPKCV